MSIKLLALFLAAVILLIVFELIRQEKLTFKYAAGWIFVSVLATVLILFDRVLFHVAHFFGFELASNFIFFSLLSVFVFLSLLMTIFLCQQNSRNDTMAQKISLLEFEIKTLKKKQDGDPKESASHE